MCLYARDKAKSISEIQTLPLNCVPRLKLESLSLYFQASGTWNYVPVLHKTIYFPPLNSQ